WQCVLYHAMLLGALLTISLTDSLSLLAVVAFSRVLLRSFWYLARPVRKVNLRTTLSAEVSRLPLRRVTMSPPIRKSRPAIFISSSPPRRLACAAGLPGSITSIRQPCTNGIRNIDRNEVSTNIRLLTEGERRTRRVYKHS